MTACSIAKSDIRDMTKVNIRYIAALLIVQFLSTYVPVVSLGLVHFFYRS
jgi:C4-dicarboxylate transporter, DctM subunit